MALIDKETIRSEIERHCVCENTEISRKRLNRVIIEPSKRWQPVEGLEEEIDKYIQPIQAWEVQEAPFTSLENCARHFAEWQRKQDQSLIELAEDHAMLAGMNKMEQQMLEKAYDTVMQFDELDDLVPTFEDMQKFGFKVGDKVKVIILKEK